MVSENCCSHCLRIDLKVLFMFATMVFEKFNVGMQFSRAVDRGQHRLFRISYQPAGVSVVIERLEFLVLE